MQQRLSNITVLIMTLLLSACGIGEKIPANINTPPYFESDQTVFHINEGKKFVTELTGRDMQGDPSAYDVLGGKDWLLFDRDELRRGKISFKEAPAFNLSDPAKNNYEIQIILYEIDNQQNYATKTIQVIVDDVPNQPPSMTSSAEVTVLENSSTRSPWDPVVLEFYDAEFQSSLTYTVSGGADMDMFTIAPGGGDSYYGKKHFANLFFETVPDFENPTDEGKDNSYNIEISVTDGENTITENITITVKNTSELPPVFEIPSAPGINMEENRSYITQIRAHDPETSIASLQDVVSYSISGGADREAFEIVTRSVQGSEPDTTETIHELHFKMPPDYETPHDTDSNNLYEVTLEATDGINPALLPLTIEITDKFEIYATDGGIKTLNLNWATYEGATAYRILHKTSSGTGHNPYGEDQPIGSTGLPFPLSVHLTDWVGASFMVEAHDSNGILATSEPLSMMTYMLDSIGYLKASNTDTYDHFGLNMALSGDGQTLAVGAYLEDSAATGINGNQIDDCGDATETNCMPDSGAVYIFTLSDDGSTWQQQAYLKPSNTHVSSWFGSSLSLSHDGNTLAIGAKGESSAATGINGNESSDCGLLSPTNCAEAAGAVYLFTRSVNTTLLPEWTQQAYIKASNTDAGDYFGSAVALSDNGLTLAVGAPHEQSSAKGINQDQTSNNAPSAGAVYLFSFDNQVWNQQAYIKASRTADADMFGSSLSLSSDGNTLAIGAKGDRDPSSGINQAQATPCYISCSPASGATYLFNRSVDPLTNQPFWTESAFIKAASNSDGDWFGHAVSLSDDGSLLAVAAVYDDSDAPQMDSETGLPVSDPQDDCSNLITFNCAENSGAVTLFRFTAGEWIQQAFIKSSHSRKDDHFGRSLSLSGDGLLLAVGAPDDDAQSTGVAALNECSEDTPENCAGDSGAVYTFTISATDFQVEENNYIKSLNTDAGDRFGISTALSADGKLLTIGAYGERSMASGIDGDNTDNSMGAAGAVYLY